MKCRRILRKILLILREGVTLAGFGAMEGTAGCNLHPFLRLLFNASCLFSDDIVECLLGKIVVCNLLLLSIEYFF